MPRRDVALVIVRPTFPVDENEYEFTNGAAAELENITALDAKLYALDFLAESANWKLPNISPPTPSEYSRLLVSRHSTLPLPLSSSHLAPFKHTPTSTCARIGISPLTLGHRLMSSETLHVKDPFAGMSSTTIAAKMRIQPARLKIM